MAIPEIAAAIYVRKTLAEVVDEVIVASRAECSP